MITVPLDVKVLILTFQLDAALDLRDWFGDLNAPAAPVDGCLGGLGLAPSSWLDGMSPLEAADCENRTAVEVAVDGLTQE